jgi:hypothetical protein
MGKFFPLQKSLSGDGVVQKPVAGLDGDISRRINCRFFVCIVSNTRMHLYVSFIMSAWKWPRKISFHHLLLP